MTSPSGGRKTVYWEEEELIGDLGEQGSGPALVPSDVTGKSSNLFEIQFCSPPESKMPNFPLLPLVGQPQGSELPEDDNPKCEIAWGRLKVMQGCSWQ